MPVLDTPPFDQDTYPAPAPPDLLPVCFNANCEYHPDGCVAVVDGDDLAEVVTFVRELAPVLEQVRQLAPMLVELKPLAAQLGAAARGGPAAVLGLLMGRNPAGLG